MRRIVSILFLALLLLQAIPVLHFFSSRAEAFYAYIDEEKPTEKKEVIGNRPGGLPAEPVWLPTTNGGLFSTVSTNRYTPPLLESMTPPPDAC